MIVLECIVYAAVIAPFIALGSVCLYRSSQIAEAQRRSSQWPSVRGQLLAAEVLDANPEIRYSYRVGDTDYESDQFALLPKIS